MIDKLSIYNPYNILKDSPHLPNAGMATEQPPPQLFGIVPTGSPLIIAPTSAPSQVSYLYNIPLPTPPRKTFSHLTIFLLPGISLPANTGAAVYLAPPSAPDQFKFLGAIGEGKESAVFKISGLWGGQNGEPEIDMDAPEDGNPYPAGEITLGISIETVDLIAQQMAGLQSANDGTSQALVLSKQVKKPDTLVLAQRIIKNAFNFLASFSGNLNGGIEVVPLKAFEEWWKKFEGRVRSDPGFLERGDVD